MVAYWSSNLDYGEHRLSASVFLQQTRVKELKYKGLKCRVERGDARFILNHSYCVWVAYK